MSKKGFIRITDQLYKQNWTDIAPIFKYFKPYRIDVHYINTDGNWHFYGTSEYFDIVPEGAIIPEYEVTVTWATGYEKTYAFKKINP